MDVEEPIPDKIQLEQEFEVSRMIMKRALEIFST